MEHASDASGASLKYLDGFIGPCLAGCGDKDADVRQASVYGVGVMAAALGANFTPHVPSALAAMAAVIQAPNARDEDNISATENAISSLGKILEWQRVAVPSPEAVAPQWLAMLPLTEDTARSMSFTLVPVRPRRRSERRSLRSLFPVVCFSPPTPRFQSRHASTPFNSASDAFQLHPDVRFERWTLDPKVEARVVHQQLVRMLEKNDPHLLGASHEHLGKALCVFATAMPTASLSDKLSLCTEETKCVLSHAGPHTTPSAR